MAATNIPLVGDNGELIGALEAEHMGDGAYNLKLINSTPNGSISIHADNIVLAANRITLETGSIAVQVNPDGVVSIPRLTSE